MTVMSRVSRTWDCSRYKNAKNNSSLYSFFLSLPLFLFLVLVPFALLILLELPPFCLFCSCCFVLALHLGLSCSISSSCSLSHSCSSSATFLLLCRPTVSLFMGSKTDDDNDKCVHLSLWLHQITFWKLYRKLFWFHIWDTWTAKTQNGVNWATIWTAFCCPRMILFLG